MQAMILAAGFGTRMAPLSLTTPKPTLPLMGRPLIAHTLQWLAGHGVTAVVMNLHHLGDIVRSTALEYRPEGMELAFVDEPEIRGTGGGLRGAQQLLDPEQPVIVVNGDIYTDMDLSALVAAHHTHGALATLALNAHPDQFELFAVGIHGDDVDGGAITDFWGEPSGQNPSRRLAFTGVHVVSPEMIDRLPSVGFACIKEAGYLPALQVADGVLYGQIMAGQWFDLGTPDRYLAAHSALLARGEAIGDLEEIAPSVWTAEPVPFGVNVCPPVVLAEGVRLHMGATVGPNVVLGAGSEVKPGASVINSVVWPGAVVEDAVWDSIVAPTATIKKPA